MFMLDRKTIAPLGSEGGPIEEFAVLGATANGVSLCYNHLGCGW